MVAGIKNLLLAFYAVIPSLIIGFNKKAIWIFMQVMLDQITDHFPMDRHKQSPSIQPRNILIDIVDQSVLHTIPSLFYCSLRLRKIKYNLQKNKGKYKNRTL
jgi:hypothetical protein